ncbi:MAG: hypothetical protein KAS32_09935, partial [Candidatus Peribacteraceae bacterium]|nr:hypothetical protein [Candidatus Peribacteraceae bacterium]
MTDFCIIPTLEIFQFSRNADLRDDIPDSFIPFLCPYFSGFKGYSIYMSDTCMVLGELRQLVGFSDKTGISLRTDCEIVNTDVIIFNNEKASYLTRDYICNNIVGNNLSLKGVSPLPAGGNYAIQYEEYENPTVINYSAGKPCYFGKKLFPEDDHYETIFNRCTKYMDWDSIYSEGVHSMKVNNVFCPK